ncbi:MAG: SIMPL domain-containing protein [Parcubacteria group bacterium]|nr:SIMPL domain-containing protein [Parcubacteria group bacterium]
MEQNIKNYLGVAGIIAILAVAYSSYSYVGSYARSTDVRSFTVSAEGKAIVLPDVAKFSFSVITEGDKNVADLQGENTKKVNDAINFVIAKHVDKKDIKTTNYNVTPRYQYSNCPLMQSSKPCPPPSIAGYTISQDVEVRVRDFSAVGDILSGVVSKGANSASGLSFTVDDQTKYTNEARAEAIQKAKDQAKSIAQAGGFRLGRLVSIQEAGGQQPYAYDSYAPSGMMKSFAEVAPSPRIEAGSNEIKTSVTLTYEIE